METGFGEARGETAEVRHALNELRDQVNRRFEALDNTFDRHFTWLVGIQVAVFLSVVGALVGSYYK